MAGLGGFGSGSNGTFLTIAMGVDHKNRPRAVIGRRANAGDPGAVQVFKSDGTPSLSKKDNSEIYRTEHKDLEGMIIKMERQESDYGPRLNISVDASGTPFILQLDRGSPYWVDFAQRCDNIDFSKPIRLQPFCIAREDDPKKFNRMVCGYQDGKLAEKVKFEEIGQDGTHSAKFDEDEKKWLFGRRDNFLDQGPIQRAIDKVAFLNGADTDEHSAGAAESEFDQAFGGGGVDDLPY